ncbi:zinc finger protein 510-like [Contarinia nasturtii]|uniref:zinc finger protein 510-like n=1 Tax=Contarinia nasturtii TaxID=265458 RepID=UPI0012D3893F|nr:zinc finger protein 510-like [Contarinia nasturtii]
MDVIKCFICNMNFVPIDNYLGLHVDGAMTAMPLKEVLEKSLHIVADVENEYFCMKCIQKIEEYDELVQQIRRIETDLYELFQTKSEAFVLNMKCEFEDPDIIENQDETNEEFIKDQTVSGDQSIDDDDEEESKHNIVEFETTLLQLDDNKKSKVRKCRKNVKNTSKDPKLVKKKHYKIEQVSCDVCGRIYQSKGALGVHLVKHSTNNPHECKICHKTFTQRIGLKRHMPIHTGEQNHQCDVCGKRFTHAASFNMHKKIHIDERPKKCNLCGAEFRSSSHIKRHMRSHTGEKPFSCTICGQKFTQGYNLKTHLKTHEKSQSKSTRMFICVVCSQVFTRREKLNEHLANAHQIVDTPSNGFENLA